MPAPTIPFDLDASIQLLERTPKVLEALLGDLPDAWTKHNEGGDSWSPHAILGHLIHGEQTDWMPRMRIMLSEDPHKRFDTFDREAQFLRTDDPSVAALLAEFSALRAKALKELRSLQLNESAFARTGVHPEFGTVTLQQLLATWVVHDLGHIAQIARVMAKQYAQEVGPWKAYLGILSRP